MNSVYGSWVYCYHDDSPSVTWGLPTRGATTRGSLSIQVGTVRYRRLTTPGPVEVRTLPVDPSYSRRRCQGV